MTSELDRDVRLHLYRRFLDTGAPPTAGETAAALEIDPPAAEAAYRRLEQGRVIVLAPGTAEVWMANPLSAYPTAFHVEVDGRAYWGSCVWDALGIPAMLGSDGVVSTFSADCAEPTRLEVSGAPLTDGVAHFAVPARRWWENIAFT